MQTFLPYSDLEASARALDDKRLCRQRIEALQIVRALTWPKYLENHAGVELHHSAGVIAQAARPAD